jgi:hypothetical protein
MAFLLRPVGLICGPRLIAREDILQGRGMGGLQIGMVGYFVQRKKGLQQKPQPLFLLARPLGLEPRTFGFVVQ